MSEIYVGEFLFRRLKQLGLETVFGVPGDYELALLDIPTKEGLNWVGTPNELVGAYAADGYARHKGIGALVTTFGPGELSALCGIGGAYCEFVPVLHIVGYPTLAAQRSGKILHHTLNDGSYEHYVKMSSELSAAAVVLKDPAHAVEDIDGVLKAMLYQSRPGYIGISEDLAYSKVPASALDVPLPRELPPNDSAIEKQTVQAIMSKLEAAQNPIIIVDGGGARHDWAPYADALVEALKLPYITTTLGKGAVNEDSPYFQGSYAGIGSYDYVQKTVANADCYLWLGNLPSDFNTGMFTEEVKGSLIIDLQRFSVSVGETKYHAKMNYVIPALTEAVRASSTLRKRDVSGSLVQRPPSHKFTSEDIVQDWLWPRFMDYLRPGDLVVTETGTAQTGFLMTDLPAKTGAWTQAVYGSIGYASGAAIGASIAAKETGAYKRMVLITGEGSLQLTVQAFSLLNRHGIVPVVFVINNGGYTVERYFHGFDQKYNDVPMWDYGTLFQAFSPEVDVKAFKVTKASELDALMADNKFQSATVPQIVDVVIDYANIPSLLKAVFDLRHPRS